MRTQPSSIPCTGFMDAFPAFMKYCGARVYWRDVGVSIRTKNFLRDRARKSIVFAMHIRSCGTMHSYRSTLIDGFVEVLLLSLIVSSVAVGADHPTIDSVQATDDVPLDLDPAAPFWREASPVYME